MANSDQQTSLANDFVGLAAWALLGGLIGIVLGGIADLMGMAGQPLAEGPVRWIAGTTDSMAELVYVYKKRRSGQRSRTEVYVFGTLIGTIVGPLLHLFVQTYSHHPYGPIGILYAFGYGNSDNLFGSLVFLLWCLNQGPTLRTGWKAFWSHPFQVGNIIAIICLPLAAYGVRMSGFIPDTNLQAGLESALLDLDSVIAGLASLLF
jgi:hypothetical protein